MSETIDKRSRARQFRSRLAKAMSRTEYNQTSLAKAVQVDRSTISQILKDHDTRLPNAQLVAECARALGVSADWLLGLTDVEAQAADFMARALTISDAPRALIDNRIFAWHQESAGYKIRHVPAGLPDMLKTDAMLEWEYSPALGRSTAQAIGATRDRLNWMRQAQSDYEIAFPQHDLKAFAFAQGYYQDCPREIRLEQLAYMAELCGQLYPRMRLHLFDARKLYSAPITVFGPLVAVIYIGQKYLAFRDSERVQALSQHFDDLVREAQIGSREIGSHLKGLQGEV